jgi:hypothetical protein
MDHLVDHLEAQRKEIDRWARFMGKATKLGRVEDPLIMGYLNL